MAASHICEKDWFFAGSNNQRRRERDEDNEEILGFMCIYFSVGDFIECLRAFVGLGSI